jgi:hypothetical protein
MSRNTIVEKLKRGIVEQDGNVAVLVALVLAGLLAMTSVVVEGGMLYATKMHLQKTANATVLSAAQELTNSESNVRSVADHILRDHGEAASLESLTVTMEDRTTVVLKKDVQLHLAKALGMDKVPVRVKATAKIEAMGAAKGAAPVGVDQSVQLNYGQEYILKVDEVLVNNGNFGILGVDGNKQGGTYDDYLANGYQGMLSVGDVIPTISGNKVGPTRSGVQARIDSSPYPSGDMSHFDDPRMMLVPVYTPYKYNGGGGKVTDVQITGFAYFYLTQSSNGKEVTGIFIKRTGIGFVKPGAVNRGAYVIKLTE